MKIECLYEKCGFYTTFTILIFSVSRKVHWCEFGHLAQRLAKYLILDEFRSLWHVVVLIDAAVPSNKL